MSFAFQLFTNLGTLFSIYNNLMQSVFGLLILSFLGYKSFSLAEFSLMLQKCLDLLLLRAQIVDFTPAIIV